MEDLIAVRGARYARERLLDWVAEVGRVTIMLGDAVRFTVPALRSFRLIVRLMAAIGVGSLWLVAVVSMFTGAVAAVQAAYQFSSVVPLKCLGAVIIRSVVIELGPVLTALVVGGRVGASIAAELGTMRVTEQVDAMETMGISPTRYLVVPRVVAATLMLPVLTIFADMVAIFGGYLVAVFTLDVSGHTFTSGLRLYFHLRDVFSGLIKSFFFGAIISTMGCYYGLKSEGGAEGVGVATTHAVVASCLLILIVDYLLASFLFRVLFA